MVEWAKGKPRLPERQIDRLREKKTEKGGGTRQLGCRKLTDEWDMCGLSFQFPPSLPFPSPSVPSLPYTYTTKGYSTFNSSFPSVKLLCFLSFNFTFIRSWFFSFPFPFLTPHSLLLPFPHLHSSSFSLPYTTFPISLPPSVSPSVTCILPLSPSPFPWMQTTTLNSSTQNIKRSKENRIRKRRGKIKKKINRDINSTNSIIKSAKHYRSSVNLVSKLGTKSIHVLRPLLIPPPTPPTPRKKILTFQNFPFIPRGLFKGWGLEG